MTERGARVYRVKHPANPAPMTAIRQADESLRLLLATMDSPDAQITVPVTSEAVPPLLAVMKIKTASAGLVDDDQTCKRLFSLKEQLVRMSAVGTGPLKADRMAETGKARCVSTTRDQWPASVVDYVRQADNYFCQGDLAVRAVRPHSDPYT